MSVSVFPDSEESVSGGADPRVTTDPASIPVSVVAERFLRAIIARIPVERIDELHLFSPLRQGAVETGIAVVAVGAAQAEADAHPRHTVHTARYRLVIKGPDRGKWESDVVEEADAPLLAVETVVRGVQRRAGGESEIVRYDAVQLMRLLRLHALIPTDFPSPTTLAP